MTIRDPQIRAYQQKCFREYGRAVGLPEAYTYPDGNPVRPVPPIQTASGGLMIIGAYPSARFEYRPAQAPPHRNRLVPVADNLEPFGSERYFDGVSVRTLTSGDGLREYLLDNLPVTLEQCWVTDLVKVFLYKPDHAGSCGAVHPDFKVAVLRGKFAELGRASLPFLREECALCRPKLIVTLGEEVAQVVSGESRATADDLLCRPVAMTTELGEYPTLFLPHPEACRVMDKWRTIMASRVELVRQRLG